MRARIRAVTQTGTQAVILAAGQGTRFKTQRPKVLHELLGESLLRHVLRALSGVPVDPVTVVVGHEAERVEATVAEHGLRFVRQSPLLGTGHALMAAAPLLLEAKAQVLLVVSGDVPLVTSTTLTRLLETHRATGAAATLLSAHLARPGSYGRVVREPGGDVRAVVEARDASPERLALTEINAGLYAFDLRELLPALDRLEPNNTQREYYLTDVIGLLKAAGRTVAAAVAEDAEEVLGVNTLSELARAAELMRRRRCEVLMGCGVVIEDPASTLVGAEVVVEADVVLRASTILEGRTVVKAGACVGPFVRLVDTQVGAGARVLDHCLLRECVVEENASVGPFSQIRPGSRIGRNARVGNFVELKNANLGAGAKASHLSYLGDVTVGQGANIGAGTITCNYDGVDKYETRIGDRAFVGSNAVLVAPVRVGDDAYIAAGSTITEDVPGGALALGRARQVVKEGYAKRRARAAKRKS